MASGKPRILFEPGRVRVGARGVGAIRTPPGGSHPPPQGGGGGKGHGRGQGISRASLQAFVALSSAGPTGSGKGVPAAKPAPAYVAAGASAFNTNGAALAVPVPAGLLTGDFMLLVADAQVGLTVNTPAGWTVLGTAVPAGDGFNNKYLYWKIAGASEGSVTVTTAGSAFWLECKMYAWRGANRSSPIDTTATFGTASNTLAVAAPATVTHVANALVVFVGCDTVGATWTPPAGGTIESHVVLNNLTFTIADEAVGSPQTVNASFTLSATNSHAQVAAFSLAPPA